MPRFLLTLLLGLLAATPSGAMDSAAVGSRHDTVTLVSATDAISPGQPFRIGLYFQLQPGWHTYWQNPGDAGQPPNLTFSLPPGVTAGPVAWPTPQRIAEAPVMTYAYTGNVLLPVTITPTATNAPLTIHARATWLVCKQICVPEQGEFRLDLPSGAITPSPQAPLFAAHDRAMPRPSPWTTHVAPDGTLSVQGPELSPASIAAAWFIPQRAGEIQDDAPQRLSVRDGGFTLALTLANGFKATSGLPGIVSVRDRAGLQTNAAINAAPGPLPTSGMPPLAQVLAFAFLGGLILNLMPCVFPVLAMKAVALAKGAARGRAHAHVLAYTTGVLVTFAALGGALLAARAAGAAAGWGFQFASPAFVAAMAWLLFAVGLNLSGVFQVGSAMAGAGSGLASREGHAGSFFTGLLAVLVATPCTAPFMGVAIAAGLAAPPAVTMLVFLVMGLGLATPYVALAAVPGLARIAPKPGRWMDVLKQALAFPMYGAAAWLLWVVSQEAGSEGVLGTAAGFVLLGFAGWVIGISQREPARNRRFGQSVAAAALLTALAVLSGIAVAPGTRAVPSATGNAQAFTPARLAALRREGRPVFVNMTAAWCVTCLVNERVAIATTAVQQAFSAHQVAYLKGDWTQQDPAISAYLRANGRDGVPLYVYYPPHGGKPQVLPQILTENTVLAEVDKG
jgi:thiol:disulfide interchange protein/DsbC/DsbD-like thiol-disulfide interchange protein